ncbi:YbhB/YbcL family Raf kinase inhibitor-like protein Ecym_1061 [Eremothecium cymbalariae DBVPG|uniref:Phosphatidylethanolamine-binding protein n=1 Tax=Eremothecium cymbalariae (strain CBS 270.75 / DBVPG 7215 / KCTC 17166 / NRRL Y-17582) TaxID=931890 RepID=G8JMB0_ERECY|nr:hypothetical protein Ecym_1061 [Eremothecium cymbalariae DBVPG\
MNRAINIKAGTAQALTEHGILPDVLVSASSFESKGHLVLEYRSEGSSLPVTLGNTLEVSQTQEVPSILFVADKEDSIKKEDLFTVVMTDPDAPSRKDHQWSEYCHYIQGNVRLSSDDGVSYGIGEGDVLVKYLGPGPPAGTGPHRYVWLLYKQPEGRWLTQEDVVAASSSRKNWGWTDVEPPVGVDRWAGEKNLELMAVNFFLAESR